MATVIGTDAGETLNGTSDADYIIGNDGEDVIFGLQGADTIDSVDRPTNIFAGSVQPQRDVVNAGRGDDFVTGGRLDQLEGGAGFDTLQVNFNFNGPVAGSATPIMLALNEFGRGTASDGTFISGFERLIFNLSETGDNVVDTGNVESQLTSGAGNDTLTTGSGNDIVYGGSGDDTISVGDGSNQIGGGAGDDIITAGTGDDNVGVAIATDGADQVNLGAGSDTVRFDRYDGGTGNIRLTFTSSEVGNGNALDGGALANQDGGLAVRVQAEDAGGLLTGPISRYDDEGVTFVAGTQGITFDVRDLVSGAARGDTFEGVVLGTSGEDSLSFFPPFREGQNFYYNAGGGNDLVTAGSGNDFLVGGGGNDTLIGNAGNDSFIGGAGNDSIEGGDGIDTVIFGAAAAGVTVRLATTTQQDTGDGLDTIRRVENVTGSAFADSLSGDSKDNAINGGAGDDMIAGRGGADMLTGGLGNDLFVYDTISQSTVDASGRDVIRDFATGDRIDLSAIDAVVGTAEGNQAFTLGGTAFTHIAGELIQVAGEGGQIVMGDVNGDGRADFAISVFTAIPLTANDFVL